MDDRETREQMQEEEKSDRAALLPVDPSAAVNAEALPKIGDIVKYDWMGAIWTDEVVRVDRGAKRFWVRGNGLPMRFSSLVTR